MLLCVDLSVCVCVYACPGLVCILLCLVVCLVVYVPRDHLCACYCVLTPHQLAVDMQFIGSIWFACVFGLLMALEVVADKIPGVAHALHAVMAVVHPIAGVCSWVMYG